VGGKLYENDGGENTHLVRRSDRARRLDEPNVGRKRDESRFDEMVSSRSTPVHDSRGGRFLKGGATET